MEIVVPPPRCACVWMCVCVCVCVCVCDGSCAHRAQRLKKTHVDHIDHHLKLSAFHILRLNLQCFPESVPHDLSLLPLNPGDPHAGSQACAAST